ncbi:MAG: helix-turn-helix transcriptional regulator [Desulfatitalea sp.]|nr:helix-turn-helix domain-containing protein [Desulfatitalea sp.]NNK02651.1 helix-turn-helix transcriptional regulator [Desulfatitalea sp.]
MPDPTAMLSTREFAQRCGVSPSTISKWLQKGKIKGTKKGGKWQICVDQLITTQTSLPVETPPTESPAAPAKTQSVSSNTLYSIQDFCEMTYLTTYGVQRYISQGRLSTVRDNAGNLLVEGANLERSDIKRLLRK